MAYAQEARSTLTAESPSTVRVNEGDDETLTIVFTVDPPLAPGIAVDQTGAGLPDAVTARLTDLRSSAGDLFSRASVKDLKVSSGREVLEVRLSVIPNGALEPADYTGQLVVSGSGITPGRAPVTLKLAETPPWTELTRYLVAAGLLALGVGAGALLTWLNSSGSELVAAERRLAAISLRTDALLQWLPDRLKGELSVARESLLRYDATGVSETLNRISADDIDSVIALAERLRAMDNRLDLTQATLAARALPPAAQQQAQAVVTACRAAVAETVQQMWPPKEFGNEVSALGDAALAVSALIELFAFDSKWDQAQLAASLFISGRNRFQEAVAAVNELVKGTVDEDAASAIRDSSLGRWLATGGVEARSRRGGFPHLRLAAVRKFNFVAGLLIAAGVILVGLTAVFEPDKTFNDIGSGTLLLVGWGLGVQTVGVTLAQLGNTLVGDRLRLTAT
jgi:hypothetical protein